MCQGWMVPFQEQTNELVWELNPENCLDLIFAALSREKVTIVPDYITSAIRQLMLDVPRTGSFQNICLLI